MSHRRSPELEGMVSSLIALFCVYEIPLSGYGIRAKLKTWRIGEYLSISPSTIYRSLTKLEEDGFLAARVERKGRYPSARVYRITAAGRKRYFTLIAQITRFERAAYSIVPVIGLASYLTVPQRVKIVQSWIRDADKAKGELQEALNPRSAAGIYGKPFAEWLLMHHEIARLNSEMKWLQHYMKLLEDGKA